MKLPKYVLIFACLLSIGAAITLCSYTSAKPTKLESVSTTYTYSPEALKPPVVVDRKVQILQRVIFAMENNTATYEWRTNGTCSVGMIAQAVVSKTAPEIEEEYTRDYPEFIKYSCGFSPGAPLYQQNWSNIIGYYSGVTNRPIPGIVRELNKAGFTNADICNLEYLSDKNILSRTDIDAKRRYYYAFKDNYLKYLHAWLSILEEKDKTYSGSKARASAS